MEYVQPLGEAANAPYVDANPVAGIDGSIVPAAAIEHPQREILAVITAAGITPSGENLAQLLAAIQTLVPGSVPAASTTVQGKVELATTTEAATGTDTVRAVTPAALKTALDQFGGFGTSATLGNVDFNTATKAGIYHASNGSTNGPVAVGIAAGHLIVSSFGGVIRQLWYDYNSPLMASRYSQDSGTTWSSWHFDNADATDTVPGLVELATTAETQAGVDAVRAVTPAGLAATQRRLRRDVITASGNWVVPSGVTTALVTVIGGGGGGERHDTQGGGGGGAGGFAQKLITDLVPGTSIPVTVGAKGLGRTGSSGAGSNGGSSSFGAYCSATGGTGGVSASGNLGGMGTGGDVNASLGDGFNPSTGASGQYGGQGGGLGGGRGARGTSNSHPGRYPGAGGGGGGSTSGSMDGANGADGIVIVEY